MFKVKIYFKNFKSLQKGELALLCDEGAPLARNILAEWFNCELETSEFIAKLVSDAAIPNDNQYGVNLYGWQIISDEYVIIYNLLNRELDVKEYILLTLEQYVRLLHKLLTLSNQSNNRVKGSDDSEQFFEVECFAEGHRAKNIAYELLNVDYEVFY